MFDNLGEQLQQAIIDNDRWQMYLKGLGITIIMSLGAIVIGIILGTLVALVKVKSKKSKNIGIKILNVICDIYLTIIRGTPSMLQILIWFLIIFAAWPMNMGVVIAIIAFGFNSGAYVAEIIRSGIQAVDRGQEEAGRSLGLSEKTTMRLIILPQAVKNILPALGNELIVLVKETAIVGYIAVEDLTKAAMLIQGATYQPLVPLILSAIIYLILVIFMTWGLRKLERRLGRSDSR